MNKLIQEALDSVKIQNFYLSRMDEVPKDVYVVYSHVSYPYDYADNKKRGTLYNILINLYCKRSIESNIKLVVDTLNSVGIKGGTTQESKPETINGSTYWNTPISFQYFEREEE